MKASTLLSIALSGILSATPVFAARGGGGHGGTAHGGSHVSAPHYTGAANYQRNFRDNRGRRDYRHGYNGVAVNAGVVYPWWLYDNGYGDPNTSSYYPNTAAGSADTPADSSANIASAPAVPDSNAARYTMAAVQTRQFAALEASPQWVQATDELNKASADLEAATARMEATLLAQPQYRAAVDGKLAAENRATQLHEQGGADESQIFASAQDDLNASALISRMQGDALAKDPAILDARTRLQAAATERQALKDGVRAQVMQDPQWQSAKDELASIR